MTPFLPKFIFTLLAMIAAQFLYGQGVPSTCEGDSTLQALYIEDAHRMAMRKIIAQEWDEIDSVQIPQAHVDTVLNALLAVYNAFDLPARDTVVEMFGIHTFPDPDLQVFVLSLDPAFDWVQNLSDGQIPTGNTEVDALIVQYGLELAGYYDYNDLLSFHAALFETPSYANVAALGALFVPIQGVIYSEPNGFSGDGYDITDTIAADHVALTYSHGWGDCLSGCINRRYWQFKVYFDCSVEFTGSYGSELLPVSTTDARSPGFMAYPNPFTGAIRLEGISQPTPFSVFDASGREVKSGITEGNQISGLEDLGSGVYMLVLNTVDTPSIVRIVKQ